ncbi:MAG: hypothetical protein ABSD74_11830 [Rhizomicrobium sp.]|jgi:hypothetical protein
MKYRPLSEIRTTDFVRVDRIDPARLRRRRLERFAEILENHAGPVRLFVQIEAVPDRKRREMRRDCSPFSIALSDPIFRADGLESDAIGEARAFFGLSNMETHELVCDCHYFGPVNGKIVAERARYMAAHPSLGSRIRLFVARFAS